MTTITVTEQDNRLVLRSGYNAELVADIKTISGRTYNPNRRTWSFPMESAPQVKDLCERWGGNFPSIAVQAAPTPKQPNLEIVNGAIHLRFPYSATMVASVHRLLPTAAWHPASKTWRCGIEGLDGAVRFCRLYDLEVAEGISEACDAERQRAEAMVEASQATKADRVVEGIALPLHPYQVAGVDYLVHAKRAILGDQVGLGKTPQAMAAVIEASALPAIVVMPLTLKLNWANEIKKFYPNATYTIVEGGASTPIESADFILVNYDIVLKRANDLLALNPKALLCDESHAIKNGKAIYTCPICGNRVRSNGRKCSVCGSRFTHPERSYTVKRTAGVMKLAEAIPETGMVVMLTGTMITNHPAELVPQLEAIGRLDAFGGPHRFTRRYAPGGGGATNLVELNDRLRGMCLLRRTKEMVYDELPPLQASVQPMRVSSAAMARYVEIESDIVEFLANRAREIAEEAGEDPHSAYWEKRMRAQAAEQLVRISTLKEAVVEMKYDCAVEWIENFLEGSDDDKVIIFGERINLIEKLYAHFGEKIAVKVRGGVSPTDRKAACDRFQTDPECRVFLGNMKAASEGLNLTAASDVVILELPWTPAMLEQCIGRCYMRGGTPHGANAWYLLCASTIEDDIYQLLAQKSKIVDAVMDGTELEAQRTGSVLGTILVRLAHRGLTRTAD